ncbi:MAG: GyrI-like domain-containing protein [Promethearchaeota archaeon]
MADKIDFKKSMKEFYKPSSKQVSIVDIPEMQFIMIDGKGSPGDSQEYIDAITSLYPIAYKLKFMSKKELDRDYVVPPLEGLWWADNMDNFLNDNRDKWLWTMMIMVPDWLDKSKFIESREHAIGKKPELAEIIKKVRFEPYSEGKAAHIMHIGPYSEEHPTILKLHEFIKENGGHFDGHEQKHHEIYLSDPRKAKPESMKTVIRQPFDYN